MSTSTVPSAASTPLLCAVYTRVSAEGRADEDFSSTDAQFMACQELIASQRGNGWQPTNQLYEDRGASGSHLRRPAMQALLRDVQAGLVDIVVVHRLDRLSRHLGDLQTLMSIFEQHGVALVSVTQSIDTSSVQGRLVLNLLTSFAQFERELIGEPGARGFWRQSGEKKPTESGWFFNDWWRRRESARKPVLALHRSPARSASSGA